MYKHTIKKIALVFTIASLGSLRATPDDLMLEAIISHTQGEQIHPAVSAGTAALGLFGAMIHLGADTIRSAMKSGMLSSSIKGAALGAGLGYLGAQKIKETITNDDYTRATVMGSAAIIAPYALYQKALRDQNTAKEMKFQRRNIVAKRNYFFPDEIGLAVISDNQFIKNLSNAAYRLKHFSRSFALTATIAAGYALFSNNTEKTATKQQ